MVQHRPMAHSMTLHISSQLLHTASAFFVVRLTPPFTEASLGLRVPDVGSAPSHLSQCFSSPLAFVLC